MTKSHVAPRPMPFPLTLCQVLPLPGNSAHWEELSLPTLQRNLPTLGDFVPRPTPTPPTPQRIRLNLCNVATWRRWPMLSCMWPSCGDVACWPCWLLPTPPTLQSMMPLTPPTSFPRPNPLPSSLQLLSSQQHVPPPHGCPRTRTNEPGVIHRSSFVEDKEGGLGSFVLVPT
jgi:hypothetical protein